MIPLRDANPTHRRPFLTYGIVALNIGIFFLWQPLGDAARQPVTVTGGTIDYGQLFFLCHGAIPVEVWNLEPVPVLVEACGGKSPIASIFSSMFLHGGLLHIAGNMLYLWIFGNNVEDRMGHGPFLGFYLLAGVAAVYAQAWTDPESFVPLVGASGAIAGILGFYLIVYPHSRVLTLVPIFYFLHVVELPAIVVLGFWFVLQAFQGVGALAGDPGSVAWFAHIGGFVVGAAVGVLYRRPRGSRAAPLDL